MPKNEKLKPVLKKHYRKKSIPITFDIDVNSINVELVNAPSYNDLCNMIPQFASATWCDNPGEGPVFKALESKMMDLFFNRKLLPIAFETVHMTFKVAGIEHTTASHLIRHRQLGFSARTHADRDNRDDNYTIPGSIYDNSKFKDRYMKICQDAVDLYGEMLDSNEVSTMDARAILPRSEETYYFVTGNLAALMRFIKQRLDVQTQPHTDNILAMLFWREICKVYPKITSKIDFEQQDMFYINAARTDVGHNLFAPAKKNDIFEWHPEDFIYDKHRDEFIGAQHYFKRKEEIVSQINSIYNRYKNSQVHSK